MILNLIHLASTRKQVLGCWVEEASQRMKRHLVWPQQAQSTLLMNVRVTDAAMFSLHLAVVLILTALLACLFLAALEM